MIKEHSQLVVAAVGATDLAVTAGAWIGSYYLRFHSGLLPHSGIPPLADLTHATVLTLLLTIIVFGRLGLYRPRRMQPLWMEIFEILRACAVVWVLEVMLSYFLYKPRLSILLQGTFLAVWPTLLIVYRGTGRAILRHLRRSSRNVRRAAIVGAGRLGQKILHALRRQRWTGYEIAYFVDDRRVGGEFLGVPVRGPISDIDAVLAREPVDAVFVALGHDRADQIADVLNKLSASLADVNVVPDLLSYHFLRHQVFQVGGLPVVNLTHSPQSGWNAAVKRLFDVVFALAALALLAPLMAVVALAVKLTSRGRVFYTQRRASIGGREFDILKFRSMYADAERDTGAVWGAAPHDPRITPVGRVLRKLSLDELPQLFNVLTGDMSLVGPRPERPEFIQRFGEQVPRYMLRHHVKAGLTGWAQVNGFRGRTSLSKRIQYDLDYINRWSFSFDLWILLRTIFRGFYNRTD